MRPQLDNRKVKTAFFMAPLISCVIGLFGMATFELMTSGFSALAGWPATLAFIKQGGYHFLMMLTAAYLIMLFFGIPCFLLLKRLSILNLFTLLLSAYVISNISLIIPSLIHGYGVYILLDRNFMVFTLIHPLHLITLLGAFCFWWIAVRHVRDIIIVNKSTSDKSIR